MRRNCTRNVKGCTCQFHKEYKFLQLLQAKLRVLEFKKLEQIFNDKWQMEEDLTVMNAKLDEVWPGYKWKKAITDMYKMGWIDNLTYMELAAKARNI
jgi:hypothetical protein